MGLDRDISLEGLKNAAINRWDKYAAEMKGEVRESGEELVEEFQKGIDSAAKKINLKSMSSQLKRAVQDFGKETKYLDNVLDGITVGTFEIDLSNIKIDSDEIKSRVAETLNDIIESGSIDAKDSGVKKIVERMLGTYFSDLEKVDKLQDSGRNLYGKQYISNAQEQIALMTEMQDIARFLGEDYFIDWSDHISTAMRCIREEVGETEAKIERTFEALKEYGKDTFDFSGNFRLDRGNFSQTELDARIQLLQELIDLQETWHFAQSDDFGDYYTGTSGFDLEDILEQDQEKLRLMRKFKVNTTQELDDMAQGFQSEIEDFSKDYTIVINRAIKDGTFDEWIESLENDLTKLYQLREELLNVSGGGRGALLSESERGSFASYSMDLVENLTDAIKSLKSLRQVKYLQDFTSATNELDEGFRALPETREKFNALCNDIAENGLTAADAIRKMTDAYEEWSTLQVGEPKVEDQKEQLQLPSLSRKERSAAFASVDLKSILSSLNIKQAELPNIKKMFTELLQLNKAFEDGTASADKAEEKFNEIVKVFLDLGSVIDTVENPYEEFLKRMSGQKIRFTDLDKAEFGDDWSSIIREFPGLLVASKPGNMHISAPDQLYKELRGEFKGFFPDEMNADPLKSILDVLRQARQANKAKGKITHSIAKQDAESIVADIWAQMTVAVENSKASVSTKQNKEEAESLKEVAEGATEATKANKELEKSAEEAAAAAEKVKEKTKKEKESLDKLTGSIIESGEAHDKIKTIYDADGNIAAQTVTDSRTKKNAIETESNYYRYEDGEKILEATTIVADFKKRAAELKREQDKIELAQKTLNKFLSQFESKTSGQASTITGYSDLKGFTISSLDDIEKATQKMIALDTEYNNVTKNFRKGTKSMNPFVNAITGAGEMGDKVKQATTSFNELSKKPAELKTKVDGLNDKLAEMRKYAKFDDDGNLLEITDIYNFSKAYGELNAEIKSVNSSIQTQRQEQRAQASELKQLESIQNKLFAARTKRATSSYDADDLDAQDSRIKRLEEEYEAKKNGIKFDENREKLLERESALQRDVDSIVERRIKREEELAWAQMRAEEEKQRKHEEEASYKERAEQIKAEAEAEKELLQARKDEAAFEREQEKRIKAESDEAWKLHRAEQEAEEKKQREIHLAYEEKAAREAAEAEKELATARKEANAFYEQEDKRIADEEDKAWKEHRLEQEAAAQKEREINLAYAAKAAQEAADAENELAKARKEADAFFAEEDSKNQKELNELYSQRKNIISELLSYTKQLSNATDDATKNAAQRAIDEAIGRLFDKNFEIYQYGDLVDQSKLDKQDESLTEGLRRFNWESYIKNAAPKNSYDDLLKLQEKIYDIKKKLVKVDGQSSDGQKLNRQLAALKDEYNASVKLLDAEEQRLLIQNRYKLEKELNTAKKEQQDKESSDKEAEQLKELLKLYKEYADAREKVAKIDHDTSGKVADQTRTQAAKDMADAAKKLQDSYGVDVSSEEKLFESLTKNNILTQEQMNALLDEDIKRRKKVNDLIQEASDAESTRLKKEQERIDKQNKNYGKSRFNTETRNYDKIMASYRNIEQEYGVVGDSFDQKIKQYEDAYRNLEKLRKIFESDPNAVNDTKLTKEFQDAALKAETLRKSVHGVVKETDKLRAIEDTDMMLGIPKPTTIDNVKASMAELANEVSNGTFKFTGFNKTGTEMYGTFITTTGAIEKMTVAFREASGEVIAFSSNAKDMGTGWDSFRSSLFKSVAQMGAMYLSFNDFIRYFRQGLQVVRDIDLAMTELKKVTDETEATYAKFLDTASKSAGAIGSTVKDFTTVASDFARLGYSIEEASELAKTALIYENVGDGFNSVEEASESIISTMKAFGIEAEGTMGIVDRFNAVGNNFAITSKGIGDALQRSASALVEGGNSIDEAIGIITAANSVIQNPEQVGKVLPSNIVICC